MKFTIVEIDNDYRTVSGYEQRDFPSREDAEAYCLEQCWDGLTYLIDPRLPVQPQK